ncbi:HSP40/DnaJ peptide-binding protein, partial [Aulographum hederae CBS 113979]
RPASPPQTVEILERPLPITLDEVFTGTTKRLKVKRQTYDRRTKEYGSETCTLDVPIKRGLKPGSKIKFTNVGDQSEKGTQDIHFILKEERHPLFTRDGLDLHATISIDLLESLCGWSRKLTAIDGRTLHVSSDGPSGPGWTLRFAGLGLPSTRDSQRMGNLIVGVAVQYPSQLSSRKKDILRQVLQGN